MRASIGFSLLALTLLTACGGPRYAHWDGRRGYNGSGDYGYDPNATRQEARSYRAHASRNYPVPGTESDPWGPYVREAAARFAIPERWIREVMHQESGGHLQSANGQLTTSWVGAMGLMQVMPQTYDMLRRRYALGDDAYEPHDNIMAGAAYIREMSDRYGAPAFLAAYNAGPDRLDAYLAGTNELPSETTNYLARVAPRLGTEVAMTGPLAVYAGGVRPGAGPMPLGAPPVDGGGVYGGSYAVASADPADRAYAGGGMSGTNYYSGGRDSAAAQADAVPVAAPVMAPVAATALPPQYGASAGYASSASYPSSYGGAYTPPPAPVSRYAAANPAPVAMDPIPNPPVNTAPPPHLFASAQAAERPNVYATPSVRPASALVPLSAPGSAPSGWGVQVGAFPDPERSRGAMREAQQIMAGTLAGTHPVVMPVERNGTTLYRARLVGLSPDMAASACSGLERRGMACLTVPPGS